MVHTVIVSALVAVVLSFLSVYGSAQTFCPYRYVTAECQLRTNPSTENPPSQITGWVTFRQSVTITCQRLGVLYMHVQIQGLIGDANSHYGIHVHESADISDGCESMGPHYNPLLASHGSPTNSFDMRHIGDFGNVYLDSDGLVNITTIDYLANLVGQHSILGRGLVLHAMRDDLGLGEVPDSKTTGNSGARLACCGIRRAKTRKTIVGGQ
ncbi:hypothetical protein ACJMK2_028423 [Sinanodonta woodiana]|uniref:Superoxide dismutase [Cu-Zn] n=1 Tax=Sinanodonta woodiana TaxID=1069815 RepID=A0ABD3X9A6_SINWO